MPRVLLHLGAHKTGTTYIQSNLSEQRERLAQSGTIYIPQAELRSLVVQNLGAARFNQWRIRQGLRPFLDCDQLILSDENIIGGTLPVRNGILYPFLDERLHRLLRALDTVNVDVVLAIRDYAGYFVSMYCEYLRYYPYISFETYTARLDFERISWVDVISRIARQVAPRRLYLVDFSTFAADKNRILDFIAGTRVEAREFAGAEIVRRTFSRQLWEELQHSLAETGAGSIPQLVQQLEGAGRFTAGERYMPLEPGPRLAMLQRYREEVAQLRRRYRFVN